LIIATSINIIFVTLYDYSKIKKYLKKKWLFHFFF
jgi:hypothetical protein